MIINNSSVPTQPIDIAQFPAPGLNFKTVKARPGFAGGMSSMGNIKFNEKNVAMVQMAREAFLENSGHKDSAQALAIFLKSLSVTSAFEGGFDAINTYDIAGVSIGFLQFARPEGGAGRLMELAGRSDLAATIRSRFGTKDNHDSAEAMKARFDKELASELVTAATSPAGIKAQFAMAVNRNVDGQLYFEKAYSRFLELNLQNPLSCCLLFRLRYKHGCRCFKTFSALHRRRP